MSIVKRPIKYKVFNVKYTLLILLISLIVMSVIGVVTFASNYSNIYPKTTVGNINVGGFTKEQAKAALLSELEKNFQTKNINLLCDGYKKEFTVSDVFTVNVEKTIENAYNSNRTNIISKLKTLFSKTTIPVVLESNDQLLSKILFDFTADVEKKVGVIKFSSDNKSAKVDLTNDKFLVNMKNTKENIINQLSMLDYSDVNAITQKEFSRDDVDIIYNNIKHEPVDAGCDVIDNKIIIKPHIVGIDIDKSSLISHIENGEKIFDISIIQIQPKITTDIFESRLFADVLSQQTTTYNTALLERTQNVTLASKSVNDTIIAAGKNFSFNSVVGRRTYERGFKDAIVFVNGKAEEGVGGGICQVSSTLYSAQLHADLQTVYRTNHQFTVSYMPSGQDATVAYGSIDYSFKNNTPYPIKIVSLASGGKLTIKIIGTNIDKDKKITVENVTINTTPFKIITETTTSLVTGKTTVKQKGRNGVTVDTYKITWRNGVEEKRQFIHRSVYAAMDNLILAGTKVSPTFNEVPEVPTPTPATEEIIAPTPDPMPSATPSPSIIPDVPTSDIGI